MSRYTSVGEALKATLEIYKDGDIDEDVVIMRIDDIWNDTVQAQNQARMDEAHKEYMKTLKLQQKGVTTNINMMKELIKLVKEK